MNKNAAPSALNPQPISSYSSLKESYLFYFYSTLLSPITIVNEEHSPLKIAIEKADASNLAVVSQTTNNLSYAISHNTLLGTESPFQNKHS